MTKLLGMIEKDGIIPKKVQVNRTHLRHEKEYDLVVRPAFKYGDFEVLAATVEGKKGDSCDISEGEALS